MLTSIKGLASSEIAFQIKCFAYTAIGDGVVFHTYLKQGTFKPCTSSRNAEEIEADTSSDGKEDKADVNDGDDDDEDDDDNDAITANHSVDYIFGEEDKENEGDDDLELEICSEVKDNDIAPSKYLTYGNGDPLRGAKLLTGVCVGGKKYGLGIVMGPRDLNMKVRNHACEPLLRKDIVASAVRLSMIATQRVKIRDGRSQAEEYDLAANLDISEQNLTLKAPRLGTTSTTWCSVRTNIP